MARRSRSRRAYKAGVRKGKRSARKAMSRYIPQMQRLGIRR